MFTAKFEFLSIDRIRASGGVILSTAVLTFPTKNDIICALTTNNKLNEGNALQRWP